MAFIKVPVITIKNLIVLLFLVIISFAVGLLGKLITNKPFVSTAQAQCWTTAPTGGGGCEGSESSVAGPSDDSGGVGASAGDGTGTAGCTDVAC